MTTRQVSGYENPFHSMCPQLPEGLTEEILSHVTSLKDFQALISVCPRQPWINRIKALAFQQFRKAFQGLPVDSRSFKQAMLANPFWEPMKVPSISALRDFAILDILPLGYIQERRLFPFFSVEEGLEYFPPLPFFCLKWTKAILELGIFEDFISQSEFLFRPKNPYKNSDKFFQTLCKALIHQFHVYRLRNIASVMGGEDREAFFKTFIQYCIDHGHIDTLWVALPEILSILIATGHPGYDESTFCCHVIDRLIEAGAITTLVFYSTDWPAVTTMEYLADRLLELGKHEESTQVVQSMPQSPARDERLHMGAYISLLELCNLAVHSLQERAPTVPMQRARRTF